MFDFDGLILETEEPLYVAYRELWAEHGQELALTEWAECIGTVDAFDEIGELNKRAGTSLTYEDVRGRISARVRELIADSDVLPGVLAWVAEAEAMGLGVGIASSSPRHWIVDHLERLGHLERFPVVACYDDVGVAKPQPDAYLKACELLGSSPADAVAVEDSVNGMRAAKAAGMRCIAVPTAMTRHFDFGEADLVLKSLAHAHLRDVLASLDRPADAAPTVGE